MRIFVNNNCCIFFCSNHVDKQVVITTRDMMNRRKSFIIKEQFLFVGQIPANSHVRQAGKCKRKILQRRMKSLKTYKFVQYTGMFMISAITQYDLFAIIITFLHFLYP